VPAFIVFVASVVTKFTLMVAFGALADLTSYPNAFACDTALERKLELSKNISFATMFALKAM
jgi:hypothetical protein